MYIELNLLYSVMAFILVYVALLGVVIHILIKDRDYYKHVAADNYNLWLEAMGETE